MMVVAKAAILGQGLEPELLSQSRTAIVRVPRTVMAELFGGWGVRI